jgi:hypothetical protein
VNVEIWLIADGDHDLVRADFFDCTSVLADLVVFLGWLAVCSGSVGCVVCWLDGVE